MWGRRWGRDERWEGEGGKCGKIWKERIGKLTNNGRKMKWNIWKDMEGKFGEMGN